MMSATSLFQIAAPLGAVALFGVGAYWDFRNRAVPLVCSWSVFLLGVAGIALQFGLEDNYHLNWQTGEFEQVGYWLRTPDWWVLGFAALILATSFFAPGFLPPTDARMAIGVLGVFGILPFVIVMLANNCWLLYSMLSRGDREDRDIGVPFAVPCLVACALALPGVFWPSLAWL